MSQTKNTPTAKKSTEQHQTQMKDNIELRNQEKQELALLTTKLQTPKLDLANRETIQKMVGLLKGIEKKAVAKRDGPRNELSLLRQKLSILESTTPAKAPAKKASRVSLKDLIASQKEEVASKARKPVTSKKPSPPPRRGIYDVSDGSDSESVSDDGDIMPDGKSRKLKAPWSQRS